MKRGLRQGCPSGPQRIHCLDNQLVSSAWTPNGAVNMLVYSPMTSTVTGLSETCAAISAWPGRVRLSLLKLYIALA